MIIAIEGIDGTGKTTLATKLIMRLPGFPMYLKFPDRTTASGRVIDHALRCNQVGSMNPLHPIAFQALQVCNRLEKLRILEAAKGSRKRNVVCDRYTMSGLVYGISDGIDRHDLEVWNEVLPKADMQVLLVVDPFCIDDTRLAGRDRELYETVGVAGLEGQTKRFIDLWMEHKHDQTWPIFAGPDRSPDDLATTIIDIMRGVGYV